MLRIRSNILLRTIASLWLIFIGFGVQQSSAHSGADGGFLFEENKGQWDDNVLYRCRIPSGYLFIENSGITYLLYDDDEMSFLMDAVHHGAPMPLENEYRVHGHAIQMEFENTPGSVYAKPDKAMSFYHNYFIGEKRVSNVKLYSEVTLKNVYWGIDLHFYVHNGRLKYDWILDEGVSPEDIRIKINGLSEGDQIYLKEDKLVIPTTVGNITEDLPSAVGNYTLQDNWSTGKVAAKLDARYIIDGNTIGYSVYGEQEYEKIIIDPVLIFSTYSGSEGDNFGYTATYDSKGHLYSSGIMDNTHGDYPVTPGAFQLTYGGGVGLFPANLPADITISKYDSSGQNLLWASYLGGSEDEYPHSLVADYNDNLIVMGTTYSDDFPTTANAYQKKNKGITDMIVSKISPDGTTLIASTMVGGKGRDGQNTTSTLRYNYADDFRGDIIPDLDNNLYIATTTFSEDFPLVDEMDNIVSGAEGIIFELNDDLSQLLWSTYLGGAGNDALYSIKLDNDSNVYVGGGTASSDLPASTEALNRNRLGGVDGFMASYSVSNRKLKRLTYFGTPEYDQIYFIEIDEKGSIYCTGQTEGNIAPSSGVYGEANKGQFIAKLDTGLSKVEFQTSFGNRTNRNDIAPSAFLVDNCEHIYVSGWGSRVSGDHPGSTNGMPITSDAIQSTTDGNDFYIIVLSKDAQNLLFATYFGGDSSADHVDGGTSRFDKKGVVYQSVCASCPEGAPGHGHQDFPTTPNAAFTKNLSYRCSNASFKIDLQIRGAVDAEFIPSPTYGCSPMAVNFTNRSTVANKFYWDFGDGTIDSTNLEPTHTFTDPGTYTITLKVVDSTTCNIDDIFSRTITVIESATAGFTYKLDPCTDEVTFTNSSMGRNFLWDFGDGEVSNEKNPKHLYSSAATYKVKLTVDGDLECPDSMIKDVVIKPEGSHEILIPNIFTPNDDQLNDCYIVDGVNIGCTKYEIKIYNRWGERVFHTKDPSECWDGTDAITGKPYPDGTYFYIINLKRLDLGKDDVIEGTITLIRD